MGGIILFNNNQLVGILLSIAKPEVNVSRTSKLTIGYRVRIRVNIRGNEDFLLGIQRGLDKKTIDSIYKQKEHKSRPRPILSVSGMVNLYKLCKLIPDNLPDAKGVWPNFKEVVQLVDNGEHHTLEGLDRILQIKGEI